MKISELEFYSIRIEAPSDGSQERRLLARLGTDSGLEGWGEASIDWRPSELVARRDVLLSILAGRTVFDVEELLSLEMLGEPRLRYALETAAWDLVGRVIGQPLHNLLGGAYRRRVPLAIRLSGDSPEQIGQVSREMAEKGFHSQIVVSSGRPEQDLLNVAAAREAVGESAELRFDADANYDIETARELCAELERYALKFMIDPIDSQELHAVASLGRQANVPLAVRRPIGSSVDVMAIARSRAAPFVVIDHESVGGITAVRKCVDVAEAAGIGVSLGCKGSLGIGVAAMLHTVAATPHLASCNECAYNQQQEIITEPMEISDGMITVPQGHGLGIEVDRAKLEKYQIT